MDGILIPIIGFFISAALSLMCLTIPRLRPYTLAALVAPFVTSVVFILGAFMLADMNPAREYGRAYIPTGREHDPSRLDYMIWFAAVLGTLVLSAGVAYWAQRILSRLLKMVGTTKTAPNQTL